MVLHWGFAAGVFASLFLGFLATRIPSLSARPGLLAVHIGIAAITILFGLTRVGWWLTGKRQLESASPAGWQRTTQQVVYGLMTLLPVLAAVSGVGMLLIAGQLVVTDQAAIQEPHTGHLAASMVIVALVVIHLGAVLYHERTLGEPVMIRMGVAPENDQPRVS